MLTICHSPWEHIAKLKNVKRHSQALHMKSKSVSSCIFCSLSVYLIFLDVLPLLFWETASLCFIFSILWNT